MQWSQGWQITFPNSSKKLDKIALNNNFPILEINQVQTAN
jgi:hypothetical protein